MKFVFTNFFTRIVGLLYLSSHFLRKQVAHSFEEEMAPENAVLQSSKKQTIRFTLKDLQRLVLYMAIEALE